MKKLDDLKKVKVPFLSSQEANSYTGTPAPISSIEAPPVAGPPSPPSTPLQFVAVETEVTDQYEPEILPHPNQIKFQIEFIDCKNVRYTIIIDALNELDAQVKIKEQNLYHPIQIISISRIEPDVLTE